MPDAIGLAERQAMLAEHTGDGPLLLMTVTHPTLPGGVSRYAMNTDDVLSRGNIFEGRSFQATLPTLEPGQTPRARLTMVAPPEEIQQKLLDTIISADVTFEMVTHENPDGVMRTWKKFRWFGLTVRGIRVQGQLTRRDRKTVAAMVHRISPREFPTLF